MLFGTSLAIQWLRLCASNAGAQVQFLVRELRSCVLCGTAKKCNNKKKSCYCWLVLHLVNTVFVRNLKCEKDKSDGPFLHSLLQRFADHSLLFDLTTQRTTWEYFIFILTICPRNRIFLGHILPVRPNAYAWYLPDVDRPCPDGPETRTNIHSGGWCLWPVSERLSEPPSVVWK